MGRVCALESANYLRNQLLRDADWAGMAHSVEIRAPLVDFDLLRAMAPSVGHMAADSGKRALAAAPSIPLTADQVDRAKTGFAVPTGQWLADTVGKKSGQPIRKGLASRAWGLDLLEAQRAGVRA